MRKSKGSIGIKQLAAELKLSPGTISIVLNGHGKEMRISKETQERVLEAARVLGYQPNIYAKRLRQGDENNQRLLITVFTPFVKSIKNVMGGILYGLQSAILNENLQVEIVMQPFYYEKLSEMKKMFSSLYCNGAIVCGVSDKDASFLIKETFDIPVVLFNHATEKYSSVYVEDYEAGKRVAYLFSTHGRKNAGLVMPLDRSKAGSMRQLGFMDGCRQFGLTVLTEHVKEAELSTDGGYDAMKQILENGDYPSALFVQISEMAAGAVRALSEANVRIPQDIEIVTYGDSQVEEFMTPSLTAIHMPLETMASECLHLVLNIIRTKDWRPVSRIQPLPIIFRESCGCFPHESDE